MQVKQRIDIMLVEKKFAASRELAKAYIMSGGVYVNGEKCEKPGNTFMGDVEIELKLNKLKYVSRGGLKLEKGIAVFGIGLADEICLDIGASTGGFTDCMLQNGARKVYAVDVGYGQLDWSLRNDERVVVMEKTNARHLTSVQLSDICGFASIDVSFISLSKIFPIFADVLRVDGQVLALIKPQFECGRKYVGKKGVVKDKSVHEYVIERVVQYGEDSGLYIKGMTFSPIKGPNGNIEYLACFDKGQERCDVDVRRVVEEAHNILQERAGTLSELLE